MENEHKLQEHINTDVQKDIEKLYDHAKIANGEMGTIRQEMGDMRICMSKIRTDVDWLKKSFWVIVTASAGAFVTGVFNLLI